MSQITKVTITLLSHDDFSVFYNGSLTKVWY